MDLRKSLWNWKSSGGGNRIARTSSPLVVMKPAGLIFDISRNPDGIKIKKFHRNFANVNISFYIILSRNYFNLFLSLQPCKSSLLRSFLAWPRCRKRQWIAFACRIWIFRCYRQESGSEKWDQTDVDLYIWGMEWFDYHLRYGNGFSCQHGLVNDATSLHQDGVTLHIESTRRG